MTLIQEQFASDNNSGICPEALVYLQTANYGSAPAYGNDARTQRATDAFRELFETHCEVFLFSTVRLPILWPWPHCVSPTTA